MARYRDVLPVVLLLLSGCNRSQEVTPAVQSIIDEMRVAAPQALGLLEARITVAEIVDDTDDDDDEDTVLQFTCVVPPSGVPQAAESLMRAEEWYRRAFAQRGYALSFDNTELDPEAIAGGGARLSGITCTIAPLPSRSSGP